MPVAIALGGDPASIYAASAPLPPTIDEFLFAGFLRREPVRLAKAVTSELEVPAEAELVLEGYIDPREELVRSEEHTSELQSRLHLVCRLLLEKKKKRQKQSHNIMPCVY